MVKASGKEKPVNEATLAAERQIRRIQEDIRFDTRDFPVELIVNRFQRENFFVPPYQREFVWNDADKSAFIESVIMGLPIPMMFIGETDDEEAGFEIVDGVQRIHTLESFCSGDLKLCKLKKLDTLNGFTFNMLPKSQQNKFLSRALRIVILDGSTSDENRQELFNRINKSGKPLKPSERRRGSLSGEFMDFLETCAADPLFTDLCPVPKSARQRREPLELVTRFFAYSERYLHFKHDVDNFLDTFVKENRKRFPKERFRNEFTGMLEFVKRYFPYGFAKTKNASSTPRVRFEAISVGVNLALRVNGNAVPTSVISWLDSAEFAVQTTTHASNSPKRLANRIEYVRDHILEDQQ